MLIEQGGVLAGGASRPILPNTLTEVPKPELARKEGRKTPRKEHFKLCQGWVHIVHRLKEGKGPQRHLKVPNDLPTFKITSSPSKPGDYVTGGKQNGAAGSHVLSLANQSIASTCWFSLMFSKTRIGSFKPHLCCWTLAATTPSGRSWITPSSAKRRGSSTRGKADDAGKRSFSLLDLR